MFCFKLWSRFGAFRDPLTITQNLTFPIPPKTTIGGMLAAVLGIDYSDYFNDPEYFDFSYSLILTKPIRKKSLAQNYVADYTKESEAKFNAISDFGIKKGKLRSLLERKMALDQKDKLTKTDEKFLATVSDKVETAQNAIKKSKSKCASVFEKGIRSPKPIFRELLMEPEYLIFIKDFKYESRIIPSLKNHESAFLFYMGNSEFAANYCFLEHTHEQTMSDIRHSFTLKGRDIQFEAGKKYTTVFMATRSCGEREYRDYRHVVICDKPMTMRTAEMIDCIDCSEGKFYCEFL